MRRTLEVLNRLEQEGLWLRYAVGGAVAALFYIEPFQTEDLDILILLGSSDAASLAPLSKIYERLRREGYAEEGPFMMIEGVPVQFLVAYSPLVEEAVRSALEVRYEDVATRVPLPEHLAAIMIEAGREKDRARFALMLEQSGLDHDKLRQIVRSYQLEERMLRWTSQ